MKFGRYENTLAKTKQRKQVSFVQEIVIVSETTTVIVNFCQTSQYNTSKPQN